MKIADLFVDLKLDTSGFAPALNKAVNSAGKSAVEVGVKAATSTLSKEVATVVKKATPAPIKVPVQVEEEGGDRAINVMDTLATRASIAAGGIGDLAGALQAQGVIGEKTAAVMETTAATIQGVAGVADLAVVSTELLKAAKIRETAAHVRSAAAQVWAATVSKVLRVATLAQAAATRVLNAAMRANPIGLVITAITGLIAVLVVVYKKNEAFRNTVNRAWAAIKNAISSAWNGVIKPIFRAIWSFITNTLIPVVNRLWKNVIAPAFRAIGTIIRSAWNNVIRPIFAAYVSYLKNVLFPVINFLWKNVIQPVFTGIGRTIQSVWKNVIKPTFDALKTGVGSIKTAFKTAVDAIGKIWDGLKSKAETPVKFVVNTVFGGLAEQINKVLPGSPLGVPKYAGGGVLPGYTPGRDVHRFYSPTGGRVDLSGGEAIMRPEWTRAVGGPRAVAAMNRRAQHGRISKPPGFFLGGVMPMIGATSISQHSGYPWATWAGDLNGLGDDTGKPVVAWKSGYIAGQQSLAGSYGNHIRMNHAGSNTLYAHLSSFTKGTGARVAAGEMIGRVGSTGNSSGPHLHFEVAGGGVQLGELGGGSGGGGGGSSVLSMIGDVKDAISDTWKSIKGMGGTGWSGILKDSAKGFINMAIDGINDKIPDFGPIPNNPIPHFDRGGWLQQGRGMVANKTGKPEAVLTNQQWGQMERLISAVESGRGGSSAPLIGQAVIRETVDLERYERQRAFRERMTRVGV